MEKSTKQPYQVKNVNENPCNMCMPMGGILPFKGIEEAMVIIHGSQGCSTYMRRHMAEHYNEPVDVASSSLNEKGTIYGGSHNLKLGLDNVRQVYQPKIVGVLSTCLAETIGEDMERIAQEYLKEKDIEGYPIVPVPTPGYGGTHSEGYWMALRKIVEKLAVQTTPHKKINIIVSAISPADIRELKRILELFSLEYILLPDYSYNLDRPYEKPYTKLTSQGTKLAEIAEMAGARATLELGVAVSNSLSPGKYLEEQYDVPLYRLPMPVGLENTDQLIEVLASLSGKATPAALELERGRLLDAMIDSHKYNFSVKAAVFGDPELVYAVSRLCLENGILPMVVATGSKNSSIYKLLKDALSEQTKNGLILTETDFATIREHCKSFKVTLAIGHSDGRYLTEREGIPLVRLGFPIHDRVGGQRLLSVGYWGTTMFLDRLTNTILEHKYANYRSSMYEQFYREGGENHEIQQAK